MQKGSGHIFRIIFAAIAASACIMTAGAQQIRCPERWSAAIREIPPLQRTDTLTIRIIGDVMMHTRQMEDALRPDSTFVFDCFRHIRDLLCEADITVANMEFTLAGKPYSGYPTFSAPESFAEYVAGCGVDVFLTANNHILDRGSEGAARTLEIYDRMGRTHGIRHIGTAGNISQRDTLNPLIITAKGYRMAMVNFTYGTNLGRTGTWPEVNYIGERKKISEAMESAADRGADAVIAFPHWGTEYVLQHSSSQENTAEWLAENGADIIIGSHPHVAQDFRIVGNGKVPVAYSLGNAVSNMSAADTQIGLMATVRITRDRNGDTVVLPVTFRYLWCSRPGGYTDTYMVLPVSDFIGTREDWLGGWEYDKMMDTYRKVMAETGIKDNIQ